MNYETKHNKVICVYLHFSNLPEPTTGLNVSCQPDNSKGLHGTVDVSETVIQKHKKRSDIKAIPT